MIYRTITHRGRKNERRSFSERDYISLLDAAHQQLRGPIVLVGDNLNTHISAAMRQMIAARDWLHLIRLPTPANADPGAQSSVTTRRIRSRLSRASAAGMATACAGTVSACPVGPSPGRRSVTRATSSPSKTSTSSILTR
jgi:hypothetical protein